MIEHNDSESIKSAPSGISGWLLLPAIGLILGPVAWSLSLFLLARLFPQLEDPRHRFLVALNLAAGVALLLFLFFTAIRFFQKKRMVPTLMISFLVARPVLILVLFVISLFTGPKNFIEDYGRMLLKALIISPVWIVYFKRSKRVKATFIK